MKLTVTGRHIEITDAIQNHFDSKMQKTLKDLDETADVHASLSAEKRRHHVEITVKTKGFSVQGKSETEDLYASIDEALEKVEKQLRKHRERAISLKNKKAHENKEQPLT